jgi:hypothetical protein
MDEFSKRAVTHLKPFYPTLSELLSFEFHQSKALGMFCKEGEQSQVLFEARN